LPFLDAAATQALDESWSAETQTLLEHLKFIAFRTKVEPSVEVAKLAEAGPAVPVQGAIAAACAWVNKPHPKTNAPRAIVTCIFILSTPHFVNQ
jgi:hypothetical protein